MYPILILRCEMICLVILLFLSFTSRSYNINNESKSFSRLLSFAVIHLIFDVITVITVNNTAVVPAWLNWICHAVFYVTAILFANEVANYVVAICYPQHARSLYLTGLILTLVYVCCLPFMDIYYVADLGTYSSAGPAAIAGYGLAFAFFISALVITFTHMKVVPYSVKSALIPMLLILMVTEVCQIIFKSLLFTGGAVTIVTVGFFFSLENPVAVFKKKAMTDALTGVRSRSSYEEDILSYDRRYKAGPGNEYNFVFLDINDLRNVNNRFGHEEGDNYITLIASSINSCMKHCTSVYRIGGDEFLVMYYKTDEGIVRKELNDLQQSCLDASGHLPYTASVAAGHAMSSPSYGSLREVIKAADYAMYQNKSETKRKSAVRDGLSGTDLNYSGLTDKSFDAMCASYERSYPFIVNLETNVARIAPAWKEYFGLENEFITDFNSVWRERIHPDYYNAYIEDITAVINGRRTYHNCDYLVKKPDGEYVKVSGHGSVYKDIVNDITYFAGFIINHGIEENTDQLTGLGNFDALAALICRYKDENRPFSILKLKFNNFARINMLYSYNVGNEIIRKISSILCCELGDLGEVFCHGTTNFSIVFKTCDKKTIADFYSRISEIFTGGIETEIGMVSMIISGGAFTNENSRCEIEMIRSCLAFAIEESRYNRRNDLVFYDELDSASVNTNVSFLTSIHADALADMQYFHLRYQPIIDVEKGTTVGAEALLRWTHPAYGEILPDRFIDFIEIDPCYYRLGLRILEESVRAAKKFQDSIPGFRINVNITALQLHNESFADHVTDIISRYDFDPGCLVLELTERCKEMDSRFLARRISELRSRGILVAFDDLGTGYSSISLLMDIPVDEIKLDRDFVREIRNRSSYQFFVQSLARGSSSQSNSYAICLEGIENEEMLNDIRQYGSFLAQGYYYSEPLLIDEFIDYLKMRS